MLTVVNTDLTFHVFGEKGTGRAVGMSRNMMFVVAICKFLGVIDVRRAWLAILI